MKKFEPIQQQILDSTSKNQLVSAGAGSGKTTVMIQKIANIILSSGDIDSLLVVTFTTLASNEMKDRLISFLQDELNKTDSNKEQILSLLEKVKTASIDTIDGFSSKTIKKYFYELNISPNIEILSDTTKDYYLTIAMKRTIKEYSQNFNNFNVLLDLFGGNTRSEKALTSIILDCFNNVINLIDYNKFLSDSLEEYKNCKNSKKIVKNYIIYIKNKAKNKIIENNYNFPTDVNNKILSIVGELDRLNENLSLEEIIANLLTLNFATFTRKETSEYPQLKEIKTSLTPILGLIKTFNENGINEKFLQYSQKIVEYYTYFVEILKIFIKNYNEIKLKNNLIDFNDLNRLMLKLLENDTVKSELINKYRYIFVDEYQDINPLQDKLIKQLTGENTTLFTVGDVKQSIYGFRGSSPEWFLNQYNDMKNANTGEAFDMNINFRSNPKILEFVNDIFTRLMTKKDSDIDYLNSSVIEPKRVDIVDDKVKIMAVVKQNEKPLATGIYSVKKTSSAVADKSEALLVAKSITELINTTFYDANLKEYRTLTYKDIAILTRSENDDGVKLLCEVLRQNTIPIKLNNKLTVSKSEGVKLILSILKCVTNTADDVDVLSAYMALSHLSIDELAAFRDKSISLKEDFKKNIANTNISMAQQNLNKIKTQSYTKTNSELIRYILNDLQVKFYLLSKSDGQKEVEAITESLNKLTSIENNVSLAEFIDIVESNISRGSDVVSQDSEDSVSIMTIHKSKGLEFPVVILYEAGKRFTYISEHNLINFNQNIGFGMDYFDRINRTKAMSLPKYAIKITNAQKGYKEELRLLYVALTRAKNKLIITGEYTPSENGITKNSYLNMILSCFIDSCTNQFNEFENCQINFYNQVEELNINKQKDAFSVPYQIVALDYAYPNANKFNIPFKNTVTGLNSKKSETESFSLPKWINKKMQYEQEDRAQIGTEYHKALEMLDLTKPYEQNSNFNMVDYSKIKLAHSVLSGLAKDSVSIKKEAEFMMYLPYNQLVDSPITDKVLVQGVVDLLIEKADSFILVDYKFSSLPAHVLKQKYAEQLNLYKLAIEKAYNKKVEHMYIYSINSGELV